MEVAIIKLSDIDFGERRRVDYGELKELADSIKTRGLIQPVAVWRREAPGAGESPYLLLAGGRRFQAYYILQMESIPCRVFVGELTDLTYREIELHENIDRKDLSWQERVCLEKEIHEMMELKYGRKISKGNQHSLEEAEGWSKRDTAALLKKSPASVSRDIVIADAIKKFPALAECKTKNDAEKLLKKIQKDQTRELLLAKISEERAGKGFNQQKNKLIESYVLKDCFETMAQLPNGCINICEVDPPYAIELQSLKRDYTDKYQDEDYKEIAGGEYPLFLVKLANELYRIMSDNSWLIFWFGPEPWAETTYTVLTGAGFKLRRITGIWDKGVGQTMHPGKYLANCYEPFYYCAKGNPEIVMKGTSNVFRQNPVPHTSKIHPTERPVELIERILRVFANPGDRLYVPFLGSGNSLLAADNVHLDAFGNDLSEEYNKGFIARVSAGSPGHWRSLKNSGKDIPASDDCPWEDVEVEDNCLTINLGGID